MKHQFVTYEAYEAKAVDVWRNIDDVPDIVKEVVFKSCKRGDVLTPLIKGKDWLFNSLCEYQPLTGKLFMEGSDLFVGYDRQFKPAHGDLLMGGVSLYIEVENRIVSVGRSRFGSENKETMSNRLPLPLRDAYYGRGLVNGLILPVKPCKPENNGRFLPIPISCGWPILYHCLDWLKLKKQYLQMLVERFELEQNSDGNHYGMRVFLVHFGGDAGGFSDSDILLLNQDNGNILHISNGDVGNMRFLDKYAEAVDQYCSHILMGKEERFSFIPFAGEKVFY